VQPLKGCFKNQSLKKAELVPSRGQLVWNGLGLSAQNFGFRVREAFVLKKDKKKIKKRSKKIRKDQKDQKKI
jgi:hypothetical protein